jgi:hypothetical protein
MMTQHSTRRGAALIPRGARRGSQAPVEYGLLRSQLLAAASFNVLTD